MSWRYSGQRRVASVLADGAVALGTLDVAGTLTAAGAASVGTVLTVEDEVVINTGGFLTVPPGTAAAPPIRFTGFLTSGIAGASGVTSAVVSGINRQTWGSTSSMLVPLIIGTNYLQFSERAAPSAPAANVGLLFAADNAAKTELQALFNTGAVQPVATEP